VAGISLTYTLTNGTTADASQVMQNFNDIVNGTSDGTKDFSINALTCAGAATFNGNVTLGNASGDDVTITGSLASSIAIKTTNTYNIGSSTLGLASIYFGANSQTVRVLGSASMSATWTLTLPVTAGTDRYLLQTNGSGVTSWVPIQRTSEHASNYSFAVTANAGALTITMNDAAGSTPSSTTPIDVVFRNATATTGTQTTVTVTSALTITIPSTATLGFTSSVDEYLYIWLVNGSSVELAVSGSRFIDQKKLQSATAIDTASDDSNTLYATSAHTSKPVRLLGRIKFNGTAGTWTTAGCTELACLPSDNTVLPNSCIRWNTQNGTATTNTEVMRFTTKQIDIGDAFTETEANDLGYSVLVNRDCLATCTALLRFSGVGNEAMITRNQIATGSADYTMIMAQASNFVSGYHMNLCTGVVKLNAGDVIRILIGAGTPSGNWFFEVKEVAF
jgi:hypothetical protein